MKRKALLFTLVFALFGTLSPLAEAGGYGYRRMVFLSDEEGIARETQVWDIECPGESGPACTFLATSDGLFSYDGASLRRHFSAQVNTLRDLAYDPSRDRLYSAGNNGFGWWERNVTGGMSYHPLELGEYSAQLQDFWKVCISRSGSVFFQAPGRLCIFDPSSGEIQTVRPSERFHYMYEVNGDVLVQNGGRLCRIRDDGNMGFVCNVDDRIMNMVDFGGRWIAALEHTGLMELEEGVLKPLDATGNRILSEAKLMSLAVYDAQHLLVGTTRGGLFITDGEGRIVDDMQQSVASDNATVLSIAVDPNSDIWLGLEAGVARIDFKSNEFYMEDARLGRVRSVVSLEQGGLLIGSNKGAFLCRDNDIRPVPGTTGSVWSVSLIDGVPYIAHDQGLLTLDRQGHAVSLYSGSGVMSIVPSVSHPEEVICGTYNGLALFRKEGGRLSFQSAIGNYTGFSRNIFMDDLDRLWIRDSQKGFIRLTLDSAHTNVVERKDFVLVRDPSDIVYALTLEGQLLLCCNRETYRILPTSGEPERSEAGDSLLARFISLHGVPEDRNATGPFLLQDGCYATGLLGGIRFSYGRKDIRESLYVSRIEALGAGKRSDVALQEERVGIPYDMNTVLVYLAGNLSGTEVEYRSTPGSDGWRRIRLVEPLQLSALPLGKHDILFRIPDSPETGCVVRLDIGRPWYLTGWAFGGYILLLSGLFLAIRAYYLRQSRKEQERARLKAELKAKSKELANINFNNAKRNRELNEIKALLTDPKTVALIDTYLDDESDWEKSEEYFNVIYDGLLEKLKVTYPGISKTDMKLCVYTKLNLSTKEIADIMNISVRSVEMARYRLRKRLGLPAGQDIAEMLKDIPD